MRVSEKKCNTKPNHECPKSPSSIVVDACGFLGVVRADLPQWHGHGVGAKCGCAC